ncbi:hypothetical protein psyc5s11_45180 [Clostridium gelidum]|uniref:Uncharacterized protein n=1 Tax=Clostridium gelidum TaxID=704125 RepID=A0ABM7TBI7_9CLOT|nr:hypothetical protein [Clostridium gelidum]BCZ48451.1 hypothetical protein psyc5s11_45180 [Clostridium gelidum]
MKFTHLGFSQERAIKMELDDKDLAILRWFIDFKDSKKITKKIFDDEVFYWVKYEAVIEEYPIFKFKKDTVYRRLKSLANKDILKHRTLKQGGVWSYYTLGNRYIELISDKDPEEKIEDELEVKKSEITQEISESQDVGNESEGFGYKSESNGLKHGTKRVGNISELNGTESESNGLKSRTKNPSTISIYHNIYSANDAHDIWIIYPNKKGKAQAIKKIPKILEKYGKEQITRCVERYAKEVQGKDIQFILNGSTYFNGRFEDYLDDNYKLAPVININKNNAEPKTIKIDRSKFGAL